jgi:hypothetical protein
MATSPDGQMSFDEVVERVLAADPESFYVQATAFEEATKSLHDARGLLAKQRRSLEDAWSNRLDQRFVEMDGLVRHLEVMTRDMPTYPILLRHLGDAIVDSRQRLLDLRHLKADADPHALADRDQQARKILDDLSATYRRLGSQLPELPERTARGHFVSVRPARYEAGVRGDSGVGSGAGCAPAKGSSPAHHNALPAPRETADEPVGDSAPQAAFGRFAQFATRPASTPVAVRKVQSFNGFARLVDQEDPVVLVVTGLVDRETTGQRARKHTEGAEAPVVLDRSTVLSTVDKLAPVRLESTHAVTAPSPAAATSTTSVITTSGPTTAAPAEVSAARPQLTLASNSSLASAPTVSTAPVAAPPPAPLAPPAAAAGPQPNPLALSQNFSPDGSSGANMMRPGLGAGVPGPVPVGRGAEVWLRGESGDWTAARTPAGQPCRDHTGGHAGDHRLGFTGDRKTTEQGEDAR